MEKSEKEKITKGVSEITDRVKKFGRHREAVKINVDLVITGQEAINYKVMSLFSSELTEKELIDLIFRLGIKNAAEIIKVIGPRNGIKV